MITFLYFTIMVVGFLGLYYWLKKDPFFDSGLYAAVSGLWFIGYSLIFLIALAIYEETKSTCGVSYMRGDPTQEQIQEVMEEARSIDVLQKARHFTYERTLEGGDVVRVFCRN